MKTLVVQKAFPRLGKSRAQNRPGRYRKCSESVQEDLCRVRTAPAVHGCRLPETVVQTATERNEPRAIMWVYYTPRR
jgi:hypothetical protein